MWKRVKCSLILDLLCVDSCHFNLKSRYFPELYYSSVWNLFMEQLKTSEKKVDYKTSHCQAHFVQTSFGTSLWLQASIILADVNIHEPSSREHGETMARMAAVEWEEAIALWWIGIWFCLHSSEPGWLAIIGGKKTFKFSSENAPGKCKDICSKTLLNASHSTVKNWKNSTGLWRSVHTPLTFFYNVLTLQLLMSNYVSNRGWHHSIATSYYYYRTRNHCNGEG